MAKCSKYHAKCKVTMPKCSKYQAKWQVLVPNCCKYKANGTGKESQKKPKPDAKQIQKLFYTHYKYRTVRAYRCKTLLAQVMCKRQRGQGSRDVLWRQVTEKTSRSLVKTCETRLSSSSPGLHLFNSRHVAVISVWAFVSSCCCNMLCTVLSQHVPFVLDEMVTGQNMVPLPTFRFFVIYSHLPVIQPMIPWIWTSWPKIF